MTDIFISYSRDDRDRVRLIAEALQREGLDVWWDPDIPPGESFSQVIDKQLKTAKCIIAVWSQSSVHSNWVQEEADDGMQRNALIPMVIDEVDLPRGFKRLQTADLRGWQGDTRDPNWQMISTQVRKLVASRAAAAAAERQAESREKPSPRRSAAGAAGASPAAEKSGGGFPAVLVVIAVLLLAGAGAGYWFFMGPGAGDKPLIAAQDDAAKSGDDEAALEDEIESLAALEPSAPQEDAADPDSAAADAVEPADEIVEAPAVRQAGEVFRDCEACPEMVVAPGGQTFSMGAPDDEFSRDESETPQVDVTIARPFAIGVYEVTYDEWAACLADGGCADYEPPDMGWGKGRRPVVNISYNDARAYVAWLSEKTSVQYRLPSEAEWEYAARAGTQTPFSVGDEIRVAQANFNAQYPYKNLPAERFRSRTVDVGSFAANGFGLHDVHGNVWEWTQDCWRPDHAGAPTDGSAVGGACSDRVLKGGAWNAGAWRIRSSHRKSAGQTERDFDTGLRVARDL